jgi:hypothetical protein
MVFFPSVVVALVLLSRFVSVVPGGQSVLRRLTRKNSVTIATENRKKAVAMA